MPAINPHPAQTWAFRFMLGAFVNGVAWGGGALLLFDTAITDGNILMVGVICGMTAGNVVTSFAIPGTTYAYLVPAILLSMLMPLTQGSFSEHTLALLKSTIEHHKREVNVLEEV